MPIVRKGQKANLKPNKSVFFLQVLIFAQIFLKILIAPFLRNIASNFRKSLSYFDEIIDINFKNYLIELKFSSRMWQSMR